MSNTKSNRLKNEFLSTVQAVDKNQILSLINDNQNEDLYTYFIKKDAFASGGINDELLNEFLLKIYSDWYFLHKNTFNKNIRAVKILTEYQFTPVKLNNRDDFVMLNILKSGEYDDVLPMSLQMIDDENSKFFVAVKTVDLYNQSFEDLKYNVRLYINLKINNVINFADKFLDKCYTKNLPLILKILNNDYRFDTITIYTDYTYVQLVVDTIEEIRMENPSVFEEVGPVNELLGKVNDYIGFGEVISVADTYFSSRCNAINNIRKSSESLYLKTALVKPEEKIVDCGKGIKYTPTEYLEKLLEKNAIALLEKKILELENSDDSNKEELLKLRELRDNVWLVVNFKDEVSSFKKTLTRGGCYKLSVKGVGESDFDFVTKLYNLIGLAEDKYSPVAYNRKKDKVSNLFFRLTENFEGLDTREFLETYFRTKLTYILNDIITKEEDDLNKVREVTTLTRLRKRIINQLKNILNSIVEEDDEGREYLDRFINDYVRILQSDSDEIVASTICGKSISMDVSTSEEIVSLLPAIKQDIEENINNTEYVDSILAENDINHTNLCLNKDTDNVCVCKDAESVKEEKQSFGQGKYWNEKYVNSKEKDDWWKDVKESKNECYEIQPVE